MTRPWFVCVCVLLFPVLVQAASRTIGPGEDLAQAYATLKPCDTLLLRGGTYNPGKIGTFASAAMPSGTPDCPITIAAVPGERVVLGGGQPGVRLPEGTHDLIFDGLHAIGPGAQFFASCPGVERITFQNGTVDSQNQVSDNAIAGCGGFITVRNTVVTGADVYGIYWFGHDSLFDNLDITGNCGYGVHIYHYAATDVYNNTLRNSRIHDNDAGGCQNKGVDNGGIVLSSGEGNKACNNEIWNNFGGIQVDYRCTNCVVANNTIHDNRGFGLVVNNGDPGKTVGTVLRNNLVYNNGGEQIVDQGIGTRMEGNATSAGPGVGMQAGGAADCGGSGGSGPPVAETTPPAPRNLRVLAIVP